MLQKGANMAPKKKSRTLGRVPSLLDSDSEDVVGEKLKRSFKIFSISLCSSSFFSYVFIALLGLRVFYITNT